ncbi:MAG: nucleotidyltransferase domain-containing protein [Bacteroides sp.]|nr:nucleotidyltransferase domain-containing protein [Ruminococcus flavefaciens]MCM1554311.1 nucleotidyltransferase domain-containing protein [Bacteroides sp.]
MNAYIQEKLPTIRACFDKYPIEKAWIFGSYARGEEDAESDVDFLVQYAKDNKLSLFDIGGIWSELHKLLNKSVDLVEDGYLLPFAIESANRDKILIYERNTIYFS